MQTTFQQMMTTMESWVPSATILRCEVGSGAHGIATEGKDDRDEMGICIEPLSVAWSAEGSFTHYTILDAYTVKGER